MSLTIDDSQTRRYRAAGSGLAIAAYVFLLAPLAVTLPMAFGPANELVFPPASFSFDLFRIFWNSGGWLDSLMQSLKVALASMTLTMVVGVPAGYWLARHEFIGKGLFTAVVMSPMVVPTIVTALGLYLYFSWIKLGATTLSIVLGHVMYITPYVLVMTVAGVHKLDRNLEFGAELMGAGPLRMFVTIVLPQLVPSLVSAALFAFLMSFDEVVIAYFLVGANTVTLPVKMYQALEWEVSPVIAAVAALMILLSLVVCLVTLSLKKWAPIDE